MAPGRRPVPLLVWGSLLVTPAILGSVAVLIGIPSWWQGLDDWWRALVGSPVPLSGPLAWFFEEFGYGLGYLLLAVTVGLLLARKRWWPALATLVAAAIGPGLVAQGLKAGLARPRPAGDPSLGQWGPWVEVDAGSFPSGHATAMGFAVVAVGLLLPAGARRWWWPAAAALCAGMVWQRTAVNAHWLSDTVAGLTLGAGVTALVWWACWPRLHSSGPSAAGSQSSTEGAELA